MSNEDQRKNRSFRMRTSLIERLRLEAKKDNRSLNSYVELLLDRATKTNEDAKRKVTAEN